MPATTEIARLPMAAQAGISQALGRDDGAYHAVADDGHIRAENARHGLTARFSAAGVEVSSANERLTLALRAYGYGEALRPVAGAEPRAEANRVVYRRGALDEWYVNGPLGLEQGFTLDAPPAGRREGPLTLSLTVGGTLDAQLDAVNDGLAFASSSIRYQGLFAMDADGRDLPVWLELEGRTLALRVDDAGARYPLTIDPFVQQAYLKASNTDAGDNLGLSVAISGDTIVVGAPGEDSDATGVNGDQANNLATNAGAVYVFARTGGVWSQQAYLKASNTGAGDGFGSNVAVSGDTIVVAAPSEDSDAVGVNGDETNDSTPDAGAVYVFTRTGGVWSQEAYLKASNTDANDLFGFSVAISGDTVVVGTSREDSNAIGVNGDETNNFASNAGAAYVFTRAGGVWSQEAYLKASNTNAGDQFANSVAVSGDTVVVGAWGEDSNATGVNGNQADNSADISGAAYVFARIGGVWSQQAYLKGSNTEAGDFLGDFVAVSGDTVVVSATREKSSATGVNGDEADDSVFNAGAVYVFRQAGGVWSQEAYLKASNTGAGDEFGYTVAISGDTVVVGTASEDSDATGVNGNQTNNSADGAGAAYVFTRTGSTWSQKAYLKASNTGTGDQFGAGNIGVSGGTVVVGAFGEDSNATGVNGNQTNNLAENAGAAYVFGLPNQQHQCKNGGWQTFGVFKNQGDCVSFVSTGGKNPPANLP
ncbi:MAG: hypothetical protein FJW14_12630 [Acidimicrobiia bacterium]|nr:hypothetical protein [Acidimicrobiia bacterium]